MVKRELRCADKDTRAGPRRIVDLIELEEEKNEQQKLHSKEIARYERIDARRLKLQNYLGMSGSSDTAYTTYYA
jgi:hypothetical protein